MCPPPGAGRHIAAAALQQHGAGIAISTEDMDAALLTRLVTDPALAESAQRLRAEIDALPTPAALVAQLADLAGSSLAAMDGH